mmetsp:Transcript_11476/g.36708  ORF Transcript_11476/g.36708 Transcript_11476/m.36708 type:complete len:260 (-) Transcript_11476:95-874(-)
MKPAWKLHPFAAPDDEDDDVRLLRDAYPAWSVSVGFLRARRYYDRQLRSRPRLTNSLISMLIAISADTLAQVVEHVSEGGDWVGLDLRRNRALAVTSAVYNGAILTSWLLALGQALPRTDLRASLAKLAATQLILQPMVYVPFFFVFHGFLLGQSLPEIWSVFESEYFALLFRLWSLFMPTRFVMFLFVPVRYQVLWDSSVSFFWQVVLSLFDAGHRRHRLSRSVSAMMDFQAFGYLEPRQDGSPFLPLDGATDLAGGN